MTVYRSKVLGQAIVFYMALLLTLVACAEPVCHNWSQPEKEEIKQADKALPDDSILHPLIRDYLGICAD